MINLVMTLRTGENGTGLVPSWEQIALDMSAKEWTSSEGETHTLEFTAKACLNRYYRHQKTEDGTNSLTSASTTITPRETTHTNTVDKDVEEEKEEEEEEEEMEEEEEEEDSQLKGVAL
jgi:hypothetical protein